MLLSSSSIDLEAFFGCETQSVTFDVDNKLNGFISSVDLVTLAGWSDTLRSNSTRWFGLSQN